MLLLWSRSRTELYSSKKIVWESRKIGKYKRQSEMAVFYFCQTQDKGSANIGDNFR